MGESLFILQPRPFRPGGVRTALNLAGEFQRRGHPVTLPVGEFPPPPHFPIPQGVKVETGPPIRPWQ